MAVSYVDTLGSYGSLKDFIETFNCKVQYQNEMISSLFKRSDLDKTLNEKSRAEIIRDILMAVNYLLILTPKTVPLFGSGTIIMTNKSSSFIVKRACVIFVF